VKLELLPRGSGKLLVRAQQLFHTIKQDGTVDVSIDLVNEGSRRLDNVEIKADPPINWTKKIDPQVVPSLNIGEENGSGCSLLHHTTQASAGTRFGSRPRRSPITSRSREKTKQSPWKYSQKRISFGTTLIILLIIGLVAGMVVFGIKLFTKIKTMRNI